MDINISTYCNSSSYSLVGLNIIKSLIELGHKPALFPIDKISNQEPNLSPYIQQSLSNAQTFDYHTFSLHINHQWMLANNRIGDLKCGMTFFETDSLTPFEIHKINYLDILFVPTNWCKSVIDKYCDVKCYVTGLGVDLSIFRPVSMVCNKKITNFLYIGKASINKGTDFAIRCFQDAFGINDNVKLNLLMDNPFADMKYWNSCSQLSPLKSKIHIVNRLNTQSDIAKLINQNDCLLATSRAESWNLPLLETMACGKSAIVTMIGGHEYANTIDNYSIKVNKMEVANDKMFFKPGNFINQGNWACLSKDEEDQCICYMREVHRKNMDGELNICSDNINRAKEFSWENCVKKILKGTTT